MEKPDTGYKHGADCLCYGCACPACMQRYDATDTVARLREAYKLYARHDDTCRQVVGKPCSCGFDRALAAEQGGSRMWVDCPVCGQRHDTTACPRPQFIESTHNTYAIDFGPPHLTVNSVRYTRDDLCGRATERGEPK